MGMSGGRWGWVGSGGGGGGGWVGMGARFSKAHFFNELASFVNIYKEENPDRTLDFKKMVKIDFRKKRKTYVFSVTPTILPNNVMPKPIFWFF